jgi:hypothetical protein
LVKEHIAETAIKSKTKDNILTITGLYGIVHEYTTFLNQNYYMAKRAI